MATFYVSLTAYLSDEVTIEIDEDTIDDLGVDEVERMAIAQFEDTWVPLSQTGGYAYVWDSVNVESVEEK